jgi:hypothetical protein
MYSILHLQNEFYKLKNLINLGKIMNFKPYILVGFSQDHINILKKDIGEPALWIGAKKTLKKYYIKYNDIENINLYIPKFEDQFLQEFNIFYKKIKEKFPIFLKCTMRRDILL